MLEKIMDLQILFCIMAASGASGAVGMLAVHLTYRRILRRTNAVTSLKEKWLNLWKTRDKLLNRMNLLVWIPSLLSTGCLVLAVWFVTRLDWTDGLPLRYLYLGTVIPVGLMILRQALDFAYREELVMNSLADYILSVKTRREETVTSRKSEPVLSCSRQKWILHFRRRWWRRSQQVSGRLLLPEVISARCLARKKRRL